MSPFRRAFVLLAVAGIVLAVAVLGVTAGAPSIFRAPGLASGEEPGTRATVESIRAAATVVGRDVEATVAAVRTAAPSRPVRPSPVGISASPTPTPEVPELAASQQQPAPSPSPAVDSPGSGGIGIVLTSPADGDRVGSSLVVRGMQRAPTPSGRHVWAFVKADVYDARWYTWHRGEILPGPDGSWAIDLYLGGPPGVRHEVLVGTVDNDTNGVLAAYLASKPGQPLSDLPSDLVPEARVTVELART